MNDKRALLEWQGKVLPADWEERADRRKWYRYQIRREPNELIRLLVGRDREGWKWKAEVRSPQDQEWQPLGGPAPALPKAALARRAADAAAGPMI